MESVADKRQFVKRKNSILHNMKPAQVLALGFAILILIGSVLLSLPVAAKEGRLPYLDALFTSTSAVCVTGLIVVNTETFFSPFGKFVIMLLIQFGGLGIMTMATMVALAVGRRISLRERLLMQEALNTFNLEGLVRLTRYIITATFLIEGVAGLILTFCFLNDFGMPKALLLGMFHAVSAFCNAGFDLFGNSLVRYVDHFTVNIVITFLIIIGGLGFSVLADIYYHRRFSRYSIHSKIVITLTVALLLFGMLVFFVLEYSNPLTMEPLSIKGKMLASYFLAVTPRTAGFNTVETGGLTTATLFLIIILMFIGASPGGTGGGVKTTTIGVLIFTTVAVIKGKEDANIYGRRLARDIIIKALAIVLISLSLVIIVTVILTITENAEFIDIFFEVTSAFGTVGLSTGLTPALSPIGKVVIMITMFAGRVGPMTLAVAFAQQVKHQAIRYPEERIVVG